MKKALLSSLLLLVNYSSMVFAGDAKFYGVYGSKSDDRNPKGDGFSPVEPDKWSQAVKPWPFNWAPYVKSLSSSNKCVNRALSDCAANNQCDYSNSHMQSPVQLQFDPKAPNCDDRHSFRFPYEDGTCGSDSMEFLVEATGLRANVRCAKQPQLDVSRNPNSWTLRYIQIKTPGEHQIKKDNNNVQTFDGELQLAHSGGGGGAKNVLIMAIFLTAKTDAKPNVELEKYIVGWERALKTSYNQCNVQYNDENCNLEPIAKPVPTGILIEETKPLLRRPNASRLLDNELFMAPPNKKGRRKLGDPPRNPTGYHCDSPDQTYCPYFLYQNRRNKKLNSKIDTAAFYYNYYGSITDPPCTEIAQWRVLMDPLIISFDQLNRIDMLIAKFLEPSKCKLGTWGKPRGGNTKCKVNVNRPIQYLTKKHVMKDCLKNHDGEWWSVEGANLNLTALPPTPVNATKQVAGKPT